MCIFGRRGARFQVVRCVFTGPPGSDPVSTHLKPSESLKVRVFGTLNRLGEYAFACSTSLEVRVFGKASQKDAPHPAHHPAHHPENTHLKPLAPLKCLSSGEHGPVCLHTAAIRAL